MEIAIVVLALPLLAWAIARWHLDGRDLSEFDGPTGQHFALPSGPSEGHARVVASLGNVDKVLAGVPRSRQVQVLREYMDQLFPYEGGDATITPADAGGVKAEWVLAPGTDASKRMLYIHGGGFIMGSPRSHRRLTTRFSQLTGGAVLAIDYRLMPEHHRMAGIEDCRNAYRWMLGNGPDGAGAAAKAWIAGDSAGGNLTLSLIAWIRDADLRAPDAAVALSPATDSTLASPSMRSNVATDPMLGPIFRRLTKVPRSLLLWVTWLQTRINPRDPLISPVRGDLSRLPRVLVQASQAEMLRDDSVRYVNRAVAAGSPVQLQTWDHMVHVWQIFYPDLAEGRDALEAIGKFLEEEQTS
jgi:epsilon-lactone hydrolase